MKYFMERFNLSQISPVDRVVAAILGDVTDRRGWRQEWDGFDTDTQDEIVAEWREIIANELE